jgi:hypothetical protein
MSTDRVYRYALERSWDLADKRAIFVGLNPSTADERVDDPTIRRCVGYAKRWGCGSMVIVNLFALRSTDPKGLTLAIDPVGPDNAAHVARHIQRYARAFVVAAWGCIPPRVVPLAQLTIDEIKRRRGVRVLGLNGDGSPKHPLYLPYDLGLSTWREAARVR